MPVREKVINGLEWILNDIKENGHYQVDNYEDEIREALALLKEQEPIRPKIVHDPVYGGQVWRCGNCNVLIVKDPYCPKCGRAVKWE